MKNQHDYNEWSWRELKNRFRYWQHILNWDWEWQVRYQDQEIIKEE